MSKDLYEGNDKARQILERAHEVLNHKGKPPYAADVSSTLDPKCGQHARRWCRSFHRARSGQSPSRPHSQNRQRPSNHRRPAITPPPIHKPDLFTDKSHKTPPPVRKTDLFTDKSHRTHHLSAKNTLPLTRKSPLPKGKTLNPLRTGISRKHLQSNYLCNSNIPKGLTKSPFRNICTSIKPYRTSLPVRKTDLFTDKSHRTPPPVRKTTFFTDQPHRTPPSVRKTGQYMDSLP